MTARSHTDTTARSHRQTPAVSADAPVRAHGNGELAHSQLTATRRLARLNMHVVRRPPTAWSTQQRPTAQCG